MNSVDSYWHTGMCVYEHTHRNRVEWRREE